MTIMNKLEGFADKVGDSLEDMKRERLLRLNNPELRRKMENLKNGVKGDIYNACTSSLAASWRLTLGAPLTALYEGFIGAPGRTLINNFSEKNPRKKKEYPNVLGTVMTELLTQYGKGAVDILQVVRNLGTAATRTAILGGRYLTGK